MNIAYNIEWSTKTSYMLILTIELCIFRKISCISCYRCDALDQPSDCPGWVRPHIHSMVHLNDEHGFYTHCVDIRLADGTVLHQDVTPENPACKPSFMETRKHDLMKRFNTSVTVICCDKDKCNGPDMKAIMSNANQHVCKRKFGKGKFLFTLLIYWILYQIN